MAVPACLRRNRGQRIRCRGLPALQLRQSGLRERRVCQPKRKSRAQRPNQVLLGGALGCFHALMAGLQSYARGA